MSMYAFIELPSPLDSWVTTPDVLFPMRSQLAAELQSSDVPDPERILLELERYVDENPDKLSRFSEAGGQLAFRTAVDLFINGLKEESLQFYELSLRLRPGDVITRLNYAIALHELAYRREALEQYNLLMEQTSPSEHLRVWILAAQIHFLHGEYAEVVRLLTPLAETYYPDDAEFWELLGEAAVAASKPAGSGLTTAVADGGNLAGFLFHELKPEVRAEWGLPPTPVPVRMEQHAHVFPASGPVDLLALLEEVRAFLAHYPSASGLYNPLLALLAYLAGAAAAADGHHEHALHLYTLGLAAEPGNINLRSHHALSLHCLGREEESRQQLEGIVADAPPGTILPFVWMLLARLYAQAGDADKASALLQSLGAIAPEDKDVHEFRAELQAKMGAAHHQPTAPIVDAPMHHVSAVSPSVNSRKPGHLGSRMVWTIGTVTLALLAALGYWNWSREPAINQQAASAAKTPLEAKVLKQAAEEERIKAEQEKLTIKPWADTDAEPAVAEQDAPERTAPGQKPAPVAKQKSDTAKPVATTEQQTETRQQAAPNPVQQDIPPREKPKKMYSAKFKGAFGIVVAKRQYPTEEMKRRALKMWAEDRSILEPDGTVSRPPSATSPEVSRIPGH